MIRARAILQASETLSLENGRSLRGACPIRATQSLLENRGNNVIAIKFQNENVLDR